MSLKDDLKLLENYRAIQDATSFNVKITHHQAIEIVVADLISKYKSCVANNHECKDSFENVLRYYLDESEFNEMMDIFDIPVTHHDP